jgi:diguanylate cyclase (GGDEF)-like protein
MTVDHMTSAIPASRSFMLDVPECAGDLVQEGRVLSPETSCDAVVRTFQENDELLSIAVLHGDGVPIGLLRRLDILTRASSLYFMDINRKKSCTLLMDLEPLCFDASTSITAMAERVANMKEIHLMDGFIVTQAGKYMGFGRVNRLIKATTLLQLQLARDSNPLTQLPGNVPLQLAMEAELTSGKPFVVAYFDIDHFKPFNDVYGYKAGDDVILACAEAIRENIDASTDFLGHVGGDDFVAILRSADWEGRAQQTLNTFARKVSSLFNSEHLEAGGYVSRSRTGEETFYPITSLSVGIVLAEPGDYHRHAELSTVAAEAKKQAKKLGGGSYFVERRSPAVD